MTVETTTSKVFATGNAVVTAFDFGFKYFDDGEIFVEQDGAAIADTLYTVTANPDGDGGTVTFITAPANGVEVLIYRQLDLTQTTKIPAQDKIARGTLENAYDKLTMLAQQIQEQLDRAVVRSISDSSSADLTWPVPDAGKAILWNDAGDGLENSTDDFNDIVTNANIAASAAASSAATASTQAANAATSEALAEDWASKTSAIVAATDYSAKEFAIGSQASTGGSSKNWASQTGADVTGAAANSRSSKSWAQDVNTGATLGGSAKDWAQTTGGTVNGTEYAAKEYAVGTTVAAGSSKDWATKTSAAVNTTFSAKEYAQGSQASTGGSAKNWASQTGADVTGASANDRSAKSWAQDDLHGATLGGSAKDWAQSGSLPDGVNKSAKSYAADAAASAAVFVAATVADVQTGTDTSKQVTADALAGLWEKGSDIASATTTTIPSTGGGYFNVTGTTTITGLTQATVHAGRFVRLNFNGILTLTHNATSLILPTGANITTAAGDIGDFVCIDSTNNYWVCVDYVRASGKPLANNTITTAMLPVGSILQVVASAVKNDTYTQSSSTFTTVTGLSVTITPTTTTSRIILIAAVAVGTNVNTYAAFIWYNGSTALNVGASPGSRTAVNNYGYTPVASGLSSTLIMDEQVPGSTSAQTYNLKVSSLNNTNNVYVNRSDTDTNSALFGRGVSRVWAIEVAA